MYYAQFACTHPGYELEQAPCVRLGHFIAKSVPTGHNLLEARAAAEGPLNVSESEIRLPMRQQSAASTRRIAL